MRPPLVILDDADLYVFPSVAAAERHLEETDVRAGVYKGVDSDGRRLTFEPGGRVGISAEAQPRASSDLLRSLAELLEQFPGDKSTVLRPRAGVPKRVYEAIVVLHTTTAR